MSLHAVILAGGSGTRFWPLSRTVAPKQLLNIFGEDSLIIGTLERACEAIGEDGQIHIVVGEALFDELHNHILSHPKWGSASINGNQKGGVEGGLPPALDRSASINYIIEPAARNTAPALALAAARIIHDDPQGTIIMLPSDHLCETGERWQATMNTAVAEAADGSLVTIGLKPTAPETGFGYIKAAHKAVHRHPERSGEATESNANVVSQKHEVLAERTECSEGVAKDLLLTLSAYPVEAFIEKPNHATAERYLQEGGYYWNSGMLVARADAILTQLQETASTHPKTAAADNAVIVEVAQALGTHPDDPALQERFATLPKVSFDNAALELSNKVKVVPTTLQWSDVGSLLALETLADPNTQGTRVIGQGIDIDSRHTLNYSTQRMVATLGLDNVLVVDTEDATLVAARDRAQDVRLVVDELNRRGAPEAQQSKTSQRPWGSWTILTRGIGYQVKEITVSPGASLSLQTHKQRSEHWIVIEGTATVECDGKQLTLTASQSAFIPQGAKHRLANRDVLPLKIVEVAVGAYLGEDDIIRYEDIYGR